VVEIMHFSDNNSYQLADATQHQLYFATHFCSQPGIINLAALDCRLTLRNYIYSMNQCIGQIALVVRGYDEAIKFYTEKLNFTLFEDTVLSETKRWVVVGPKGENGCRLLLAKAANEEQMNRVGNQTGGRVFLFLYTDDFSRDYQNLLDKEITIVRTPSVESYGTVAVFSDLYGNLWDLIGRSNT